MSPLIRVDCKLLKSMKTCDERSIFAISIIFLLNIYFHDFSVKKLLNPVCKTKQVRVRK